MTPIERAIEALNRGNPMSGERIITDAAKVAAQAYGRESPEACRAQFEASQYFHAAGKQGPMLECLRAAAALVPRTPEDLASRFGYLFQLGAALDRAGQLTDAETVLRSLVLELSQNYGELSSATATAYTALSGVMFEQGEIEEALELLEGAVTTLNALGDPGIAPALALRAFVVKAYSPVEPAFPEELELEPEDVEVLVKAALERVPQAAPQLALLALREVDELAESVLGESHPARRAVLVQCVHTASAAGDAEAQLNCLSTLDALAGRAGEALGQADVALALAEAHAAQGRTERAHQEFIRSAKLSEGGKHVQALALARHAQYASALGEDERARELIEQSVDAARESKEPQLIGSCLVTQGVLLQHQGDPDSRIKLEAALDFLPLGHADADIATEHLEAAEAGVPCGCFGDPGLLKRVAEALSARLPEGLVRGVEQASDGFRVDLTRQPSAEEHALVEQVLSEVMQELQSEQEISE